MVRLLRCAFRSSYGGQVSKATTIFRRRRTSNWYVVYFVIAGRFVAGMGSLAGADTPTAPVPARPTEPNPADFAEWFEEVWRMPTPEGVVTKVGRAEKRGERRRGFDKVTDKVTDKVNDEDWDEG